MEEYLDLDREENIQLQLNNSALVFLNEIAKWSNFLAVLGFVGVGFVVLIALFAGAIFSLVGNLTQNSSSYDWVGGSFISVFYLIVATIYFFPMYYLYQFSSKLKSALKTKQSDLLVKAFENLKSHYKFIGIVTLLIFSLYALFILGIIVFAITVGIN